eukprot:366001-Chlamydomonas_euryale.AAC.7
MWCTSGNERRCGARVATNANAVHVWQRAQVWCIGNHSCWQSGCSNCSWLVNCQPATATHVKPVRVLEHGPGADCDLSSSASLEWMLGWPYPDLLDGISCLRPGRGQTEYWHEAEP